jgi:Phosphatidylserine/phosphatidylglycerophosphate/cardiolipin synthases and related enzymes
MWNSSIKIDYIAGLIVEAIECCIVNGDETSFAKAVSELKVQFPNCNDEEITSIISLCLHLYSAKKAEHADLVLTAPDSFRVKTLKTKDSLRKLIEETEKSLTITGYSISDYFTEMLDLIIRKSQQGVYIRLYVNDMEKQKTTLERLMAYKSRFIQVYEYQKQEGDKMAALHAKLIVSDTQKSLVSSANLSYHGMQGNIEMGFLIESVDKAKQIEEVMKEMVRMKVFCKYEGR